MRSIDPKTLAVISLSLICSWVMFLLFWPLAAVIILAVGIYLATCSKKGSVALLLGSPLVVVPVLSLVVGVGGYFSGTGCLRFTGELGLDDLDPKYRCYHTSSGCVVDGSEWLYQTPNNLAIEGLTALFGPMRGNYRGPYPTREEAVQAIRSASHRFLPSEFPANAAALGLPHGGVEKLVKDLEWLDRDIPIGAVVFQEETLLLGREKCILLVELKTGRRYARYFYSCSTWSLVANGKLDEAIAELDHAVEVDPRNPEYWKERGDVHVRKGDREKAAADFRKALQVAPESWYYRADVEAKLATLPGGK